MSGAPNSDYDSWEPLVIGNTAVDYNRQLVDQRTGLVSIKSRLFLNDPWELIANAITRKLPSGKERDIAQSFQLQAEDYFHAATTGRELAVKPVLLYYGFLNLSKVYGILAGRHEFTGPVFHGMQCKLNRDAPIDTEVTFNVGSNQVSAFRELLQLLGAKFTALPKRIPLGHILPQILPGHRLWCDAARAPERFLSIDWFRLCSSPKTKNVWIMLDLTKKNFRQLNLSEKNMLAFANLDDFDVIPISDHYPLVRIRQRAPTPYSSRPEESLQLIIPNMINKIWETVRFGSPYRKYYIYCSPTRENRARLPQISSIYLLMFVLSYATRYDPEFFDSLLNSDYGPFFATFISESPMQFLYLLSSEIIGREVSKPAII